MIRLILFVLLAIVVAWSLIAFLVEEGYLPKKPPEKNRSEPLVKPLTNHQLILRKIAEDEHALHGYMGLDLLPHNDSEVTDVCTRCKAEKQEEFEANFQKEIEDKKRRTRNDGYAPSITQDNVMQLATSNVFPVFQIDDPMGVEAKRKAELAKLVENERPVKKLDDYPIRVGNQWMYRQDLEQHWEEYKSRGGKVEDFPLGSQLREFAEAFEERLEAHKKAELAKLQDAEYD